MTELEERFIACAKENAQLKEEIRFAGGWLQSDGGYKWAYWQEDGNFKLLPVDRWIEQRKQDAQDLARLRRLVETLNNRPDGPDVL